ncbi:hypothetical protein BKA70DRAFT_674989 [Coprinopsis sp. MPI-PUGE-AT-0042]|nr:hypothetical protein BKA70DRAFT_378382 [Coprinopsis sp. MPI-PUGE-AT-0042]KAH6902151.1 hypothetical protein BKA70DRAFT_674989 [Coprinopsis sp. MPI-PUGE-AT-0042]
MQFLATLTILLTAVSSVLAQPNRAERIKAGLAVVGNQQFDQYHASKKAADKDFRGGNMGGMVQNTLAKQSAKNTNNALAKTVAGVRKAKRAFLERQGLELLGRDETHEYFARALPEEEVFERDFDLDDLFD